MDSARDNRTITATAEPVLLLPAVSGSKAKAKLDALAELAEGATVRDAAQATGISEASVYRAISENRDWLNEKREEWQRTFLNDFEDATRSRLEDAKVVDSRTGAQSYKVAAEVIYGLGGNQVNIHNGDTHQTLSVSLGDGQRLERDPEREAELRALLGMD